MKKKTQKTKRASRSRASLSDSAPSKERLRAEFLKHCADIRDHVLSEDRRPTAYDKLNLMIFSMLVLIDGESCAGGPYPLLAISDEGDSVVDISGALHENWCDFYDLPQEGSDAAWDAEIANRIARFDAGESQTVAASEVFAHFHEIAPDQSGKQRKV